MRIKHIAPTIAKRYLNPAVRKRALFLKGPAGIGKSEAVFQASDMLASRVDDWQGVIDIRLSQMQPEDLRGIPAVDHANKIAEFYRFNTLPQDGAGLIFLDEITSAPPAIQAAAYQLVLTPQDFGVPATWMIMAAGNSKSDRGVTHSIGGPLLNRFCQIEVETTLEDVREYALKKGVSPAITSFWSDRPDFIHKFEPTGGEVKPFPTPRSWFAVNDLLQLDLPNEVRVECIKGDIGEEAGIAFEAHMRVFEETPRIDDILEGKDVQVPDKMNALYCVAMGLVERMDKDNVGNAWKFLERCPAEIQTLTFKLAYKRDKGISKSAAFTKWAAANQSAFSA